MKVTQITLEHKGKTVTLYRRVDFIACDELSFDLFDHNPKHETWVYAELVQVFLGNDDILDTVRIFEVINTLRTL